MLALAVHLGLLVALTAAVNWRTRNTPQLKASAELRVSAPQLAAARAAGPAPTPAPAWQRAALRARTGGTRTIRPRAFAG